MPRIRTVKPEFWADEKLAGLSRDARLLFIGLFNFADDAGRMRGSPMLIRAQVFPYDTDIDSESLLRVLDEASLIARYEVAGESYIWIRNFTKHQKIDRPSESIFPTPPQAKPQTRSTKPRRKLDEPSPLEGKGKEQGKEGKGEEPSAVATLPAAGRTVPTRLAYESAFRERWGAEPLTGRMINGQLAKVVELVGAEDAPAVARFYVKHNQALYVNAKHPINLLLRDAQKLRTEWSNNAPMTGTEARHIDQTEANVAGWMGMAKGAK